MNSTCNQYDDAERAKSFATLKKYSESMADEESDFTKLESIVLHYSLFLRNTLSQIASKFDSQHTQETSSVLQSGKALSPWHAAACLEDRTRTAAFIRGTILAVKHKLATSSERPLHLIEAGCGPLGALVLPLLAYFDAEELEISVIDFHEESTVAIERMFNYFNFNPRIRNIIQGDATSVTVDSPAHLILTETMSHALYQEPQVAISQKLVEDHPKALLIPQSIQIGLALVDCQKELSHFPPQQKDRIELGIVFELSGKTAQELKEVNGVLPAATITLPGELPPNYIACFTTLVQVFEANQISDYQSQITLPKPLDISLAPGETLQFVYQLGSQPGIRIVR